MTQPVRQDSSQHPAPARREGLRQEDLATRMRQVEQDILSRAPEHQLQPSLDRIRAVMELLGDPQRTIPVIHLTGTNGKTSTTRIIETLLHEFGLRTGRFTSPHLHTMRERIALSGQPIDAERFLRAYDEVIPCIDIVDAQSLAAGGPRMTYFEVIVAIAYAVFADAPVDVAVVEVGLGGSWDATNVIDAAVSVILPIDIDHRHFLGDTVAEIATEKAGIIKAEGITVLALQGHDEAVEIVRDRVDEVGARLVAEGIDFGVTGRDVAVGGQLLTLKGLAGSYPEIFVPLHGAHQAQNVATAVAAVEAFLGGGEQQLDLEVVQTALASVSSPGRLEVVRRSPTVIVDAAHNPHGALALREALSDSFTFSRTIGVLAILSDKDATEMLEILEPAFDELVVTRTTSPRAMRPGDLGALAGEIFGEHRVHVVADLPEALDRAAELADDGSAGGGMGGGVVATGSVTTAAEVRMLLGVTETG